MSKKFKGKTACCIEMLQILNTGRIYNTSELADLLETNPRNIVEYRREIEECGYYINSIPGRYGGYQLEKSIIFPTIKLNDAEKDVLIDSIGFIESKNDFVKKDDYKKVIGKVLSAIKHEEIVEYPFIIPGVTLSMSNEEISARYDVIDKCIKEKRTLIIDYLSTDNIVRTRKIEPYKLFVYDNCWYVIGYCYLANTYRYFQLTRIEKFEETDEKFIVSKYYNENEYFDKNGFKQGTDWRSGEESTNEWVYIKLLLHGKPAMYVKGYVYGLNQKVTAIDQNNTILECDIHYKYNAVKMALGYGLDCEVLEPKWLKDEVINIAEKVSKRNQ